MDMSFIKVIIKLLGIFCCDMDFVIFIVWWLLLLFSGLRVCVISFDLNFAAAITFENWIDIVLVINIQTVYAKLFVILSEQNQSFFIDSAQNKFVN